jgi:hypothetical protein
VLRFKGTFAVYDVPGHPNGLPGVDSGQGQKKDPVFLLDPRAVVTSNGIEVYRGDPDYFKKHPPKSSS